MPNEMIAHESESVTERIARLSLTDISEARMEKLEAIHAKGVPDEIFSAIADANRAEQGTTIVLPASRLESLSRGKGWARLGKGKSVEWGERVRGGYECGPGHWVVGGSDGFKRSEQTPWDVSHINVAGEIWTIAQ